MKRAKQRKLKPRNLVEQSPLLKKGGVHKRVDKRASRAKRRSQLRRQLREDGS